MLKNSILSSISGQEEKLWVNDVFSTWLYTGNGATQTINNGIDLAGKGGLVWSKCRDAIDHALFCTALGQNIFATSQNSGIVPNIPPVISFDSNGYSWLRTLSRVNQSTTAYVSWTFRNADKFYSHQVVTKSAGSNAVINFANLGTLGMVRVKRTDAAGSWYIWHRSLSAGQLLIGETTAAAATLGHVTVSGTTVTLVNGVIADGAYLVEAFAHDSSADGIIQCGSFNTDASGNATVNIGWEPQYLLYRTPVATDDWWILDSIRGWSIGNDAYLLADTNTSEGASFSQGNPTASGFYYQGTANRQFIYLAIRRPNKPPTTGTQVYNAIARTGTGAAATSSAGFPVDLVITKKRSSTTLTGARFIDRLRGKTNWLDSSATTVETSTADTVTGLDSMTGVALGADATTSAFNTNSHLYVDEFFRRAPGFMETICDTGTGAAHAIAHNLTKAPEIIIRKSRSAATQWEVWHSALAATEKLVLNSTAAKATDAPAWNSTVPTASQFTVGTGANVNANAATFVTYLFATLAGISKVGSYIGNGSSQPIDCGFSTGARFILIKRVDSTGDWYIWDSVRGIVSANDPHLSLNTTAAEVTTDDSVDPASQGFSVNQNTATNINVNLASYIFLAIA